jgi:diadenosine tetraphosphate (Ap4A) HIT family hydrolase
LTCPFCEPNKERIAYRDAKFICLWDGFHHISIWFEATDEEQTDLLKGISIARQKIQGRYSPDGFNIGINIGESAGQTVPHLHIHVIPRYKGDVIDPRGGVRYVIPDKANYLVANKDMQDSSADYSAVVNRPTVYGNEEHPLLPALVTVLS